MSLKAVGTTRFVRNPVVPCFMLDFRRFDEGVLI